MFDENLDIFFTDFATEVLMPDGSTVIKGIFEDPYTAAQLGSYRVVSVNPTLLCKWEDVKTLRHNDTLTIEKEVYCVEGTAHHDGTGVARIILVKRSLTDNVTTEALQDY